MSSFETQRSSRKRKMIHHYCKFIGEKYEQDSSVYENDLYKNQPSPVVVDDDDEQG